MSGSLTTMQHQFHWRFCSERENRKKAISWKIVAVVARRNILLVSLFSPRSSGSLHFSREFIKTRQWEERESRSEPSDELAIRSVNRNKINWERYLSSMIRRQGRRTHPRGALMNSVVIWDVIENDEIIVNSNEVRWEKCNGRLFSYS